MKESTVRHPQAGLGCFATQAGFMDEVNGYYYGTVLYSVGMDIVCSREVSGAGVISVTEVDCWTFAIATAAKEWTSEAWLFQVWIGSYQFSCSRLVNGLRYLWNKRCHRKKKRRLTALSRQFHHRRNLRFAVGLHTARGSVCMSSANVSFLGKSSVAFTVVIMCLGRNFRVD